MADQAITMNTSSTMEGRAQAFGVGVTFNGSGAGVPVVPLAPEMAVAQPLAFPDGHYVTGGGSWSF